MKDIYELLNDLKVDNDEIDELEVTEFEREKVKKELNNKINKKKFKNKKGIIVAAMIGVVGLTSLVVTKPSFARNIPIIGDLMELNYTSRNAKYSDYMDVIGETKSNNGIDVTFENAVADDNMLLLSYIVKNNNQEFSNYALAYSDAMLIGSSLTINGKGYGLAASADWELIDNNTIRVLKEIHWGDEKLADKLNIKVNINELFGVKSDWSTEFAIDKSAQSKATQSIAINKEINFEGENINVKKVTVSPLTVRLEGRGTILPDYIAIDNNGEALKWKLSSQDGKIGKRVKNENMYIANENMESIKFIPVERTKKEEKILGSIPVDLSSKEKIKLEIDKNRAVIINEMIVDGEFLFVKYDITYMNKVYNSAFNTNLYIKVDGKILEETNDYDINTYHKYVGKDYMAIFKIDNARNIEIGTYDGNNIKISEEKAFIVELNN